MRVELGPLCCHAVGHKLELNVPAPDSLPAMVDRAVVPEVELAASSWTAMEEGGRRKKRHGRRKREGGGREKEEDVGSTLGARGGGWELAVAAAD